MGSRLVPAPPEVTESPAAGSSHGHSKAPHGRRLALLSLGALGIVYGDIGTSPLYSMRECFHGEHAVAPTHANVLGVLSLIFWALVIIVTLKYRRLRAARRQPRRGGHPRPDGPRPPGARRAPRTGGVLLVLGLFGAALLYGDGMITPAISVLSAVEGLKVATHFFNPYIVPITIAILVGLFAFQRRGTGGIGAIFGPVMLVWFATIALLGLSWLVKRARRPRRGQSASTPSASSSGNGRRGFLVLGASSWCATGGEALYADMGHFGAAADPDRLVLDRRPGAPAQLLRPGGAPASPIPRPRRNPFYHLAPDWALYPLVVLATVATVIASQAVISGAFSLTHQAVQLGYLPRVEIVHTSLSEIGADLHPGGQLDPDGRHDRPGARLPLLGQPGRGLRGGGHRDHGDHDGPRLHRGAAASGTGRCGSPASSPLGFLTVDLAFFGANIVKVADGGWFPLMVGLVVYSLMSTWQRGRQQIAAELSRGALPFEEFVADLRPGSPHRVPGAAIFMARDRWRRRHALLHNLKHNKVLHEQVVLLTILPRRFPRCRRRSGWRSRSWARASTG